MYQIPALRYAMALLCRSAGRSYYFTCGALPVVVGKGATFAPIVRRLSSGVTVRAELRRLLHRVGVSGVVSCCFWVGLGRRANAVNQPERLGVSANVARFAADEIGASIERFGT